ncbi:MAG: 2-C-methyl-D-erythritol 4-phosphate cytidylyltransferase, partial [Pseudomonadota bacterium]
MNFSAVIVAAGSSSRAGPGVPKPWRSLGGRPILRWSAEALVRAGAREIIVVTAGERVQDATEALAGLTGWKAVAGGATRAESVQAGLAALSASDGEDGWDGVPGAPGPRGIDGAAGALGLSGNDGDDGWDGVPG